MTRRFTPLVTEEVYHVFNKSIAGQPIFLNKKDYSRAVEVFNYYRYSQPPLRFSHFNRLSAEEKEKFLKNLSEKNKKQVTIFAYCLMPNHFHFLIKAVEENGLSLFLSNFQNSYAKYFNQKYDRNGSLFQSMFKAVRMETDEQLIHVSRYIHLNPFTSFVIKEIKDLENYWWSSFLEYIGKRNPETVDLALIKGFFPKTEDFKLFVYNQADYQRELDKIKHLIAE